MNVAAPAPAAWHRGLDSAGRMFTFAITPTHFSAYLPQSNEPTFETADGGRAFDRHNVPVSFWQERRPIERLEEWKRDFDVVQLFPSRARPGRFYSRMHRGPEGPPRNDELYRSTVRVARSLSRRLEELSQVVEPDTRHRDVFGHEIRQLLILACTEVESAWAAVLRANNYAGNRWSTRDYVKLLAPMKLDSYAVTLASVPSYGEIWPFERWDRIRPTESLPWYDAYNATKHNREANLHRATFDAAIRALAAVQVMTVVQFGYDHIDARTFHKSEAFDVTKHPITIDTDYIRPLPDLDVLIPEPDGWRDPISWPKDWVAENFPF